MMSSWKFREDGFSPVGDNLHPFARDGFEMTSARLSGRATAELKSVSGVIISKDDAIMVLLDKNECLELL